MSEVLYALYDSADKLVVNTIDENKLKAVLNIGSLSSIICLEDTEYRYLKVNKEHGRAIAITTDQNYIKSRKQFERHLASMVDSIETIKNLTKQANDDLNASTHRLVHNLTSINAHNIQEIYSEFPQHLISGSGKKNITQIQSIISTKPKQVSSMILRLAKNNIAMKAEFSVFKRLYDRNTKVDMNQHPVHRVLMNIMYTFFPDFSEKEVYVNVHDSKAQAYFDYDTVHVALYHILDNAAKYTENSSAFDIIIKQLEERVEVAFSMQSIVIEDNELELIYQEGYSGINAHELYKSGHGIGMARVKAMLTINNATIRIDRVGDVRNVELNGMSLKYQHNIITLSFLISK
ncbi:ATP-binding protein [Shewanella sp. HL-SH8]|uniref:ATP-binding protein n=1 Tax=Shewanella sp. HL-SH8 TaxID=3436242 RepID=UPI003EB6E4FD